MTAHRRAVKFGAGFFGPFILYVGGQENGLMQDGMSATVDASEVARFEKIARGASLSSDSRVVDASVEGASEFQNVVVVGDAARGEKLNRSVRAA